MARWTHVCDPMSLPRGGAAGATPRRTGPTARTASVEPAGADELPPPLLDPLLPHADMPTASAAAASSAPARTGRPRPALAAAARLLLPAASAAAPRVVNFIVPPCWVGGGNQKPLCSRCPGRHRQSLGAPCPATRP